MNEQLVLSVLNEKLDEKIKSSDLVFWSTYKPKAISIFPIALGVLLFGSATFTVFSGGLHTKNLHPYVQIFSFIMPIAAPLLFLWMAGRLVLHVLDTISGLKYNPFIAVTKDFIFLNEHGGVIKISISDIVKIEISGAEIHYTKKDNVTYGLEATYMKEPLKFIEIVSSMI